MIIDLGKLEDALKDVEAVFEAHGLSFLDKKLLLQQIEARLGKQAQKQQMNDAIQNLPLGNMMKRVMEARDES